MTEAFRATGPGIRLGPLALPNRVILAPMSGVTDLPFRRLVAELWLRIAKPAKGLHMVQLAG
jgi:tRNA-dihydrouridine synthase